MLPLHAYRRKMETRILGQYGDVLHEDQLWELAAGDQTAWAQSDEIVLPLPLTLTETLTLTLTLTPTRTRT